MVRMPVSATPTSGPAEESQFLSDVCTSLTEALRVAHCPYVTFCWLHAIIKVSQSHTWWRSVQELGRCIIIATSDCRCKKSKRRGCEVKVPFHPDPYRKVLPNFFLPGCIHPAGENTTGFGGTSCRNGKKS